MSITRDLCGWLRITQETDVVISPISYVVSYAVQNNIYSLNLEDLNIKGLCLKQTTSYILNRLQSLEIYLNLKMLPKKIIST